jgi:hypothetical protein
MAIQGLSTLSLNGDQGTPTGTGNFYQTIAAWESGQQGLISAGDQEIVDSYNEGNVVELFGTGTAAVISSISKLKYNETILNFNSEHAGDLGTKLYKELTDIQYGRKEDKFNWMTIVK